MKIYTNSRQTSIEDVLMSLAEGFPASHSAWQEEERARQMTATSGRKLGELLLKQGRSGSFLKTLLDCSPFWSRRVYLSWRSKRLSFFVRTVNRQPVTPLSAFSEESLEVLFQKLEQQDMYYRNLKTAHQSFCVFQLAPLTRPTEETESGLLLTPTRTERQPRSHNAMQRRMKLLKRENPVPGGLWEQLYLISQGLLPEAGFSVILPPGTTGRLNPRFVAEMMGFPVNWTALPFQNGGQKV